MILCYLYFRTKPIDSNARELFFKICHIGGAFVVKDRLESISTDQLLAFLNKNEYQGLCEILERGHPGVLKLILQHIIERTKEIPFYTFAWIPACQLGDVDIIKAILTRLNEENELQNTLFYVGQRTDKKSGLEHAIERGNDDCIKLILASMHNARESLHIKVFQQIFVIGCKHGRFDVISQVIHSTPKDWLLEVLKFHEDDSFYSTGLDLLLVGKFTDVIEKAMAQILQMNIGAWQVIATILPYAAASCEKVQLVKAFNKYKGELKNLLQAKTFNQKQTALSVACASGNMPVVEWLVERLNSLSAYNENVKIEDSWSRTALHWACGFGNENIVKILLDGLSDDVKEIIVPKIDKRGNTPLHLALLGKHKEVIDVLLAHITNSLAGKMR